MASEAPVKARACGSCGEGMLRPASVAGMVMEHRDDPRVRIRRNLVLPVCDVCGDMALDAVQTDALDGRSTWGGHGINCECQTLVRGSPP